MFWQDMMRIKLQEVMRRYRRKTDKKMTYELLAEKTGIPAGRLKSIGGRPGYNATLTDLNTICIELDAAPNDLLEVALRPASRKAKK